ncbi:hypothetical protein [Acuticoccus kandeliae]|uniref:hypothetical protein n=1 Tax=Acuticoccus kandeliae TaxID=2073160 RepID=UPI000D3EADBF|nr:hypothetical protein [Acuticoccus kandeliae]
MNRRAFLAGAAAVPVAASVPFVGAIAEPAAPIASVDCIGKVTFGHVGILTDDGLKIIPFDCDGDGQLCLKRAFHVAHTELDTRLASAA